MTTFDLLHIRFKLEAQRNFSALFLATSFLLLYTPIIPDFCIQSPQGSQTLSYLCALSILSYSPGSFYSFLTSFSPAQFLSILHPGHPSRKPLTIKMESDIPLSQTRNYVKHFIFIINCLCFCLLTL